MGIQNSTLISKDEAKFVIFLLTDVPIARIALVTHVRDHFLLSR